MKLIEMFGRTKSSMIAISKEDLLASIKNGKFTKDGSELDFKQDFSCSFAKLTSLIGCPKKVGGDFFCSGNELTSLEGCPEEIGIDLYCRRNEITSLEGIHKRIRRMNGGFYTEKNLIKSHVLGLLKIRGCREVELDNKEVEKIMNKYLPLGDLLDCQEELIEAGFEEYAQL